MSKKWKDTTAMICEWRFWPLAVGIRTRTRYVTPKGRPQFNLSKEPRVVEITEPIIVLMNYYGESPYGKRDERYDTVMHPSAALNLLKWLQGNKDLLEQLAKEEVE